MPVRYIDELGRCCGRKPLVYKRDGYRFCCRCDRRYHLSAPQQIPSFLWLAVEGGFQARYPNQDYASVWDGASSASIADHDAVQQRGGTNT